MYSRNTAHTKILRSPVIRQVQVPRLAAATGEGTAEGTAEGSMDVPPSSASFGALGLNAELQTALAGLSIKQPTEIQVPALSRFKPRN